jgi:hypothetical protein
MEALSQYDARSVFLRDDLGEEAKADAVLLFDTIVTKGVDIRAAYADASHIPFDLISRNQNDLSPSILIELMAAITG